jgi:type VI secretion system secreted protein Hcp
MANDMFLKIAGIKGESTDDKHKDEIDILSYSFVASNTGSFHQGTGGGSGKASCSNLHISKNVDASSPDLLKACLTGKHLEKAVLTVRKAGGSPLEYMVITLTQVLVAEVAPSGSGGPLSESISLHFAEIHVDYDTQNAQGTKGDHYAMGYSLAQNTVV